MQELKVGGSTAANKGEMIITHRINIQMGGKPIHDSTQVSLPWSKESVGACCHKSLCST